MTSGSGRSCVRRAPIACRSSRACSRTTWRGSSPGRNRPALLLTIQGRVTADVRVAADDDALLLDVDVRVATRSSRR
jgi:folate-binding Fe-S cluster repair protein YgfZ